MNDSIENQQNILYRVYDFTNKIALITGASSGIGKTTAIALSRLGVRAIICARNEENLIETANEIKDFGGKAEHVITDVADSKSVSDLFSYIKTKYGRLDLAFNNAGIGGKRIPLHELTEADMNEVVQTNYLGIWRCMKHEIQLMRQHNSGNIVNNASVAGLTNIPDASSYHSTKHAVISLTKTAALENADRNIRINVVCPASVRTPLLQPSLDHPDYQSFEPLGRPAESDEVSDAVIWLMSDYSSFLTGHALPVDGGLLASQEIATGWLQFKRKQS